MSGYVHCGCRDCFDIVIATDSNVIGGVHPLCDECADAGCGDSWGGCERCSDGTCSHDDHQITA